MMLKKIVSLLFAAAVFLLPVYSEEGFVGIFDDDAEDGLELEFGTDDDFDLLAAVSLSGETGLTLRSYMDDGWESELSVLPYMRLETTPSSGDLEAMIRLDFEAELISAGDLGTIDSPAYDPPTPADIIDELYLKYFFSNGYLETGYMKVEWGKGDGYHVLDPINPLSQSSGILPDINEMKDSVNMVKLNFYAGSNGLLEIVYIPVFGGHVIADSGRWALIESSETPNLTTELPGGLSGSSAAVRYSASFGPVDLGIQYYYGYKPEPGYLIETVFTGTTAAQMADPDFYEINTTMLYTRAHLLGLEAGWAAGPFTFRLEAGGWLTEDWEGDLPEYWNSSLVGLAGFDVMIPGTELFFSLQATESWVMNYKDRGSTDINTAASYDNKATTTNIIPALELPFGRGTFNLRLAGIYLLEAGGWMALPSLSWFPADSYEINLSGQFFGGEDESYYKSWEDNSSISVSFSYLF